MDYILKINQLNKSYKDFSIKDLSFSIEPNTIMGLIGPNGSGKTTTLKAIMNMVTIDSGTIEVFNKDHIKDEEYIKRHIGYVYDECPYFPHLSLKKNASIVAPFYHTFDEKLLTYYLDAFHLNPDKKLEKLSKGMKTKFSIAMALSHRPKLLIMDEPTAGLDPIFRRELLSLLHASIEETDSSILFSSHITSDLDKIADYVTFIYDGKTLLSMDSLSLKDSHKLVKGHINKLDQLPRNSLIGTQISSVGFEAITNQPSLLKDYLNDQLLLEQCSIEDLMYYYTKELSK